MFSMYGVSQPAFADSIKTATSSVQQFGEDNDAEGGPTG